jgi:hypothetical protein
MNCYSPISTQNLLYPELYNYDSRVICLVGKLRPMATSSMYQEEPSSVSKKVKIAHQQTHGLLLSNCYCLVFELLLSDLYSEF